MVVGASAKSLQADPISSISSPHNAAAAEAEEKNAGNGGNDGTGAAEPAAQGLLSKKKPYCLRVHVFQCRGLPSSEASGLLDPYIKVIESRWLCCAFQLPPRGICMYI